MNNHRAGIDLREHVADARARGRALHLERFVYGPATGGTRGFINDKQEYYDLLAGHAAITKATAVLEIGTHYGGSTLSILEGMRSNSRDCRLVTVDITYLNEQRLALEPEITRIQGDASDLPTIENALSHFNSNKIDFIYIDALKSSEFVNRVILNIRKAMFRSEFIFLDDVQSNEDMAAYWDNIEQRADGRAYLISRDFPEIRRESVGFGVLYSKDFEKISEISANSSNSILPKRTNSASPSLRNAELIKNIMNFQKDYSNSIELSIDLDESSNDEYFMLRSLAHHHYTGFGEIVDVGTFLGSTAEPLCQGLQENLTVPQKVGRIYCVDHFVNEHAPFEKYLPSPIEAGETTLPFLWRRLSSHMEKVNIIDLPLRATSWIGKPIELLSIGHAWHSSMLSSPISEFLPSLMPGRSLVLVRDIRRQNRPWSAYLFLSLKEHFSMLAPTAHGALFINETPVPSWKIQRIVEHDFSPEERVSIIIEFARDNADSHIFCVDLLCSAILIAKKEKMGARASSLIAEARALAADNEHLLKRIALLESK